MSYAGTLPANLPKLTSVTHPIIYGVVFIDGIQVGIHSIPYDDLKQKNIPVQVLRRSMQDRVYLDDYEVGDVSFEWEDRVSDIMPGERTLIVTGLVEVYD